MKPATALRGTNSSPPPARRGSGSKRRPPDRREQILAAAAELFATQGFERTAVRQIADAVDMLPGSLYHHFAAKEDILHEILRLPLERMAQAHRALLDTGGNAEERLVASVRQRFGDFVQRWELNAILLNDSEFFRSRPDFGYVQHAKSASFKVQEAILLDGMRARLFRPDLDVYMMIGTVARMLSSAGHWFRTNRFIHSEHPDSYTMDRVVNFHIDCVLRLVRPGERLADPIPDTPAYTAML
ncbi:MAG TPA: TetR/AcrR family transcriptional regulator [Novosphingobium sp.]|mgnify:CR=1 FL=1|nr:TetR/AcrR family transcriptional regulator [Novosphingobium sp.]